jgi:hypothetical protein
MSFYIDNSWKEGNVSYVWRDIARLDSIITHRKTHVEMIHRPDWGVACYMDGDIQSCELDEALYHESLVHPVMSSVVRPKRVMIVGGGEGATAREVLKWPSVEHVDMYEWDEDVVRLFQMKYPQWAKGAWDDPRLHLHFEDIFEKISAVCSCTCFLDNHVRIINRHDGFDEFNADNIAEACRSLWHNADAVCRIPRVEIHTEIESVLSRGNLPFSVSAIDG